MSAVGNPAVGARLTTNALLIEIFAAMAVPVNVGEALKTEITRSSCSGSGHTFNCLMPGKRVAGISSC
jgi:hypothetical protein